MDAEKTLIYLFSSDRWLCCVVASAVNWKHLRVNDHDVQSLPNQRACVSVCTSRVSAVLFPLQTNVTRCLKKEEKKKKQRRTPTDPFCTFKVISTNPALLSPVSPTERRQKKDCVPVQRQMTNGNAKRGPLPCLRVGLTLDKNWIYYL